MVPGPKWLVVLMVMFTVLSILAIKLCISVIQNGGTPGSFVFKA